MATRPTPVIDSASPRLNAMIRARPKPARGSEIAPHPLQEHPRADPDDQKPGGEVQPRVQVVGTMSCERALVTSPSANTPTV
jgi:hypothetical protein